MLELQSDNLVFNFASNVHPCAKVNINFIRTLRIPDDDKAYPLPPGLGNFPVRHIEDFAKRVPEKWLKRGGVLLPMYQSEALWISFSGGYDPERRQRYPFAVKVATGKTSALTGKPWSKKLKARDYCVVPLQPWLDGYVVDDGYIRQFVAMPLGGGFTVEEQVTGKAEFGGIQLEVIPMKRSEYERRFPKIPPRPVGARLLRSAGMWNAAPGGSFPQIQGPQGPMGMAPGVYTMSLNCSDARKGLTPELESMGMGAGGRMKQQLFDDPFGLDEWDTKNTSRCFVHLANSMTWRAITGDEPPTTPFTADYYTSRGMPWFDYYSDGPTLKGTETLKGIKTVKQVGQEKGVPALPENTPVAPKNILLVSKPFKEVKDGVWK